MGVRDMDQFLERWEMDVPGVRRRMILAPVPRERERWYALWLLAQGWTAQATAEALERDPHTIGRWHWTVVGRLRRGWAHSLDIRADRWCPPRPRGGAAGGAERGGAGVARQLRHGTGQLELESDAAVCLGALRYQPEPQHLPELSAPAGILLQTPQETAAQGGCGETGGLRGGVRRPVGRGSVVWGQDILR